MTSQILLAIVAAIFLAEGGGSAQYPYGIRSIPCDKPDTITCRQACINTVANNFTRWQNKTHGAGQYNTYLEFLASRYAPINADNDPKHLNDYWLRNVRFFLKKQGVKL